MSGLEAAASLFGSDNANADPFASLGSNEPEQNTQAAGTTVHHNTNEDLFGGAQGSDFLADSYENKGFVEESGNQSQANSYYDNNWSSTAPVGGNVGGTGYDTQTWYGNSGQAQNDYSQHSNDAATLSNLYDPYAPAAANASTPSNSYDPYAPPTQVVPAVQEQSPYAPSQPAPASSSYTSNTYSQPASTMPSYAPTNYGNPSYTSSYATSASSLASVPPPPAPKAPLNRPKVSNAYDPPFPVSNTNRRSTLRTGSSLSSAFGAYASPPPQQQHPPPPPANTSPYGSPYAPPHPSNQPPSSFYDQPSQSMSPPAPGYRPPSTTGRPHGQSAYGGSSEYSPQSQPSAYTPPTRADSVQSAYVSTNGYKPSSAQTYPPPAAPKDAFTPSAHPGSQTTVNPPPPPAANANINHYGLNRTASPRTQSPLLRNGSPAASYPAPPKRSSVQQTSTSTPPPPHGGSRMSSPVSVRSQRVHSPDVSQAGAANPGSRTASPAAVFSYPANPYTPSSSNTDATYVHQDASSASTQLDPEDPEGSPYIPSVGPSFAQPTTGVEAFSVADNTSISPTGNENPYLPKAQTSGSSFTTQPITNGLDSFTPYEPAPVAEDNPYAPKAAVGPPPPARSMSNGSIYSPRTSISNDAYDPYAPSRHPRKQQSENDYGSYTSRYDYPNHDPNTFPSSAPLDSLGPPQELLVKAPTHTPYAPSPSLLGTNDPLGRTSARIPVFSFGFGGKIVTCFHGADTLSTGFDVALASRNSTGIQIRILNKVVPESALDLSPSSFPGPLFSDPGSPTTGLVRPGVSAQMKTKKARIVKYLTDRAEEISQGLGYLHAGSLEKRQAEGKLVLVKLLKITIEHDGKLLGTSQAEAAVRNALVPELELSANGADTDTFTTTAFATVGEDGTLKSQSQLNDASDAPIAVTSLRPSSLDKIQDFLLRGEKRKAYHFALDQKLWAHAMVVASGIDREAWKEVVNEFLRTELGSKDGISRAATYGQVPNGTTSLANGREPLRVAYSLFSGQGAAAVQELIPQNPMAASQPAPARLPLPPVSHTTPMTPNFATQISVANIPEESLSKWAEMISMMISSTMSPETSSALTALGDQLCGNQWVEAGHVCYLLSSQTSPIGGVGNPSARIVLLSAPNPQTSTKFLRDTDPIIFSEILEFAMGLAPPVKGHEPFQGLAHLQAYRLVRAMFLAEIGEISLANRYCEAITVSMNRASPYFTQVLSDQLKGLSNRIAGTSHSDKSGSWMGSKIGKPSLDSIGGWLEGRFTKLVTGDSEDNGGEANEKKSEDQGFIGPFSHYSAISSTTTSNDPSPQSSVVNLNTYAPSHSTYAPNRTGSSMSNRSLLSNGPQERAASAMDYAPRRKASPGPKVASASASTTTFAQSRSFGQSMYSPPGTARQDDMTPRLSSDIHEEDEGQEVSWWGGDNGRTPTTATFVQLSGEHAPMASSDGFISLMDNDFAVQSQTSSSPSIRNSTTDEEEEEDLGFGNSKKPPSGSSDGEGAEDAKTPATKEPAVAAAASAPKRPDIKPAQAANASSSSWLSRWWKRDSMPGPIKANLGEEKSFYYDAELKRWVNKSAGEPEAAKPTATPPPPSRAPSRAQTASPGMSGPRPPSAGPPPARPASAADLSAPPPPKTIMRVRSNLVPTPEIPEGPGSAPSTPTGTRLAPPGPPPGRPRSQASKRNIRSRYVDVFQQEGAA